MCFLCSCEGCFLDILPWWSTSRSVPVPGIVALIMSLIITSLLEYSALSFVSKSEGQDIPSANLEGRLS